jgi:hypothetical protein
MLRNVTKRKPNLPKENWNVLTVANVYLQEQANKEFGIFATLVKRMESYAHPPMVGRQRSTMKLSISSAKIFINVPLQLRFAQHAARLSILWPKLMGIL